MGNELKTREIDGEPQETLAARDDLPHLLYLAFQEIRARQEKTKRGASMRKGES